MVIHVRFEGNSVEYTGDALALNGNSSNQEVLSTLARLMDVEASRFSDYVVDRRPSGDIVVRPEAVYG